MHGRLWFNVLMLVGLVNCGRGIGLPATNSQTLADGSGSSSGSPPQHPKLLATYPFRPTWKVAGVDYAVGYPVQTVLSNPSNLATMAGVSVNVTAQTITVTASGTILDSYDFSLNGGWVVDIVGAANVSIKNCKFALTSAFGTMPAITADANSPSPYIGYNVIDGGGAAMTNLTVISLAAGGTVEFNWLKNSSSDMIEAAATAAGNALTVQYNLIEAVDLQMNTDGNYLKLEGGSFSSVNFQFNTMDQNPGAQLGAGGVNVVPPAGSTVGGLQITNNTLIAAGMPGVLSFMIATAPAQTTSGLVKDNYCDVSGAIEFTYAGSSGANLVFTANPDMATGSILPPQ